MRTPTFTCMLAVAGAHVFGGHLCTALAWDAHGHRTITRLALDGFVASAGSAAPLPDWLTDESARAMVAYQSSEADRYRGTRSNYLAHENNPDHFLDVEDLETFGLTLSTMPPLRYQYVAAMAVARHVHPEEHQPHNPRLNPSGDQEWPGFVAHAIAEHHAKLTSAFKTVRTLEQLNDPARAAQLQMARANVLVHMGHLSHFVGDAAQPLHTTRHHHGWVGDNPNGYTTDRAIHAFIDGAVLTIHSLNYDTLRAQAAFDARVDAGDPWRDIITYIQRSHDAVEPLYMLHKSGQLTQDPGRPFIAERLLDASSMLAALYTSAWNASAPTDRDVQDFVRYDSPARAEPAPGMGKPQP